VSITIQPALFGMEQAERTSDDYYTPAWIFERMNIQFDVDVCAPPGGIPWIPAAKFYTKADDGLSQDWTGCVWMNPPYSRCTPWVQRFIEHGHGIALLPHAKSLWHSAIWNAADGLAQTPKRVIFVGHDGDVSLPTFFAAFGEECVEAIGRLGVVRTVAS
jgi:hypothetical protein